MIDEEIGEENGGGGETVVEEEISVKTTIVGCLMGKQRHLRCMGQRISGTDGRFLNI